MRGIRHDDSVRAAVLAALLAGESIHKISADHKIDKSQIYRWRKAMPAEVRQHIATDGQTKIEDLIADLLRTSLTASTAMLKAVSDETYLRKHTPHQIAVMYGVNMDKIIRLLSAVESANVEFGSGAGTD